MAGFNSQKPGGPITGINVTPLVDITLVLLIIFMVTAKFVMSRALPMDLPRAATGGEIQSILSIALRADGSTVIDGDPSPSDGEFVTRARAALARDAELRAVVHADGSVAHSRVMHALDVLRQAGITRVAFGVEQGPAVEAASAEAARAP